MKKIQDPRDPKRHLHEVVPETKCHKSHINLIDSTHPLLPITIDCLRYNEEDRPSAQELCHRLATLKESPQYGDSVQQTQEKNRPAEDTTADRESQIRKLKLWKEVKSTEQIHDLQQQLQVSKGQIQEKNAAIHQLQEDSRNLKQTGKLKFTWKTCGVAPCEMMRGSATVCGSMAYFGPAGSRQVFAYNSDTEEWSTLPDCPRTDFTLTVINGLITAVGGSKIFVSNTLFSLVEDDGRRRWVKHFPHMPTKRRLAAVVCSGKALVVAGGKGGGWTKLTTVEVMDVDTLNWSTASSLPCPLFDASATVCGDRVYLVGGIVLKDIQQGQSSAVL